MRGTLVAVAIPALAIPARALRLEPSAPGWTLACFFTAADAGAQADGVTLEARLR